ncbi:membrane protein insertion efficiency factor YidD [uncultured Alistipes sp.]|uniref:membrane protein insertion efficiency factor YidD n=1 Tax=Alistipes sp. TaxID=1872444 RepID=UPI00266BD03E|nr:membrane protein insertion efficiency factor YidD [uncultured Alistipes sp.]
MPCGGFWNASLRGCKRVAALPLWLLVKIYQYVISPLTPPSCRFTPTCSQYAAEALRKYGPLKGSWLALRRLSRCHPWGGSGYDPVP